MCSSHRPTEGADSADEYRTYSVLLTDELGDRFPIKVRAIGPKGAKGQAVEEAHALGYADVTALTVEELDADFTDAELQRAKDEAAA